MNTPHALTVASTAFEAARQLDTLPAGHRCRSLHGHGFRATVFAALPSAWASYPGGEVDALRQRLQDCVAPLNYAHLNQQLQHPSDEALARWIAERLDAPGLERVALQSTPEQGVDLDRNGLAHAWRRFRFQAAHRLPKVPPGHMCGRMHGHGFEAILHARQDLGAQPPGLAYDALDALWAPLHARLNYQCLNEIEGLGNPTSEMLSAWIWQQLKPLAPALSWVTVFETGSCGANFDGSGFRIWKDFSLDSAVQLKRAPDGEPRRRLHGHTYKLRLHLSAELDAVMGWTIDFGDVKQIFDPLFKALDHHPLHEISDLADADAASLAAWVLRQAQRDLPSLTRVDVYETPGCGALVASASGGPAMPV